MTFLFEHFGTLLAGVHLRVDRKLTNWLNRDPDIVKFTKCVLVSEWATSQNYI